MAKQTEENWKEYAYAIFSYLENLYYSSPCSFILHGGDWLGSNEAYDTFIYKLSVLGGIWKKKFDKFALLVGNHETGLQGGDHTGFTHDTLAQTLLRSFGKTYYKFQANTFDLYCFDSWGSAAIDDYAKEQIHWFASNLKNNINPHIAIAIHILHDNNILKPLGDTLTLCAKYFNEKNIFSFDDVNYDFSNTTGTVSFVIAGHTHADDIGIENDIPYIETTNMTGYSETNFSNLPLPLDLIKIDWNNKILTAYRAARETEMTSRTLNIL